MHGEQDGARFEAHVSKGRTWIIILLALGFAAIGVGFASAATELARSVRLVFFRDPFILRVFGWTAVVIGVLGAVIAARQLLRTGPVIEIDARGIRWLRWSDKFIPWSAITDAAPRAISGQQFLCLTLDRPEDHASRSITGMLAGMNRNMGFGDVAIGAQGTDRSIDELMDAVARFRPVIRR